MSAMTFDSYMMLSLALSVGLAVAVGLLWRKLRQLQRSLDTTDHVGYLHSQRLDVHAIKTGLLTRAQLNDIHEEMPESPCQWDHEALEQERKALVPHRESSPELH